VQQKWPFVGLIVIGVVMLVLVGISAIFFDNFGVLRALVGVTLTALGIIGYRMAKQKSG
jgi:threonine/homoserine efflux transporter RhtA